MPYQYREVGPTNPRRSGQPYRADRADRADWADGPESGRRPPPVSIRCEVTDPAWRPILSAGSSNHYRHDRCEHSCP